MSYFNIESLVQWTKKKKSNSVRADVDINAAISKEKRKTKQVQKYVEMLECRCTHFSLTSYNK